MGVGMQIYFDGKVVKKTIKKFADSRGILSVLEQDTDYDFDCKRVFFLDNFQDNRGYHSHAKGRQLLIVLRGSIDFVLESNESFQREEIFLNKFDYIIMPASFWREINNPSDDTLLCILNDHKYSNEETIYGYENFRKKFP